MNDAQSTAAGLRAQDCPGGGWTGMPAELEGKATVADCLAHGVCGCIYGDAVQHIERMQEALERVLDDCTYDGTPAVTTLEMVRSTSGQQEDQSIQV